MKREKTKKLSKIRLIYDSKLKSNVIGGEIRGKTCNLTENHARNDRIDYRIKGFSFRNFKNELKNSRGDFS